MYFRSIYRSMFLAVTTLSEASGCAVGDFFQSAVLPMGNFTGGCVFEITLLGVRCFKWISVFYMVEKKTSMLLESYCQWNVKMSTTLVYEFFFGLHKNCLSLQKKMSNMPKLQVSIPSHPSTASTKKKKSRRRSKDGKFLAIGRVNGISLFDMVSWVEILFNTLPLGGWISGRSKEPSCKALRKSSPFSVRSKQVVIP